MICCNPSLTLAAAKARTETRLKPASIHEPSRHEFFNTYEFIHPGLGLRSTSGGIPEKGVVMSGSGHATQADSPGVFNRLLRIFLPRRWGNRVP